MSWFNVNKSRKLNLEELEEQLRKFGHGHQKMLLESLQIKDDKNYEIREYQKKVFLQGSTKPTRDTVTGADIRDIFNKVEGSLPKIKPTNVRVYDPEPFYWDLKLQSDARFPGISRNARKHGPIERRVKSYHKDGRIKQFEEKVDHRVSPK